MQASVGFSPIIGPTPRVLILGSLPSRMSLQRSEYYANPRNVFWRIMGELFEAGPELEYAERAERLTACGVAVWDVLASSVRPGSLDADIDERTAEANDFAALFAGHRAIDRVFFNGRKAGQLFRRKVLAVDPDSFVRIGFHDLPSTSPAHASMSYDDKLVAWAAVREALYNRRNNARRRQSCAAT